MENCSKRKKRPIENRQIIIDTALDIITSEDWTKVTFQAISDKTGLSKGGIMYHFKSKDELFAELIKFNLSKLTDFLNDYKDRNGVANNSKAYLEFVLTNRNNKAYQKVMRVIIQSILAKEEYRLLWEEWLKIHILSEEVADDNIMKIFFFLVAEGVWYTDSVGFSYITDDIAKGLLDLINKY